MPASYINTHLWLHCWQAKHSKWYTFVRALITISKAGMTLLHAAQYPVVPNNLKSIKKFLLKYIYLYIYYDPFYIYLLFPYNNQFYSFRCKLCLSYEHVQTTFFNETGLHDLLSKSLLYSVYVNISIIMVISAARCAANFKFYGNHLRVLLRFLSMNASCYTSKFYRVINRNN